jgi:transcriptional regulator with XRE-family HTH domain
MTIRKNRKVVKDNAAGVIKGHRVKTRVSQQALASQIGVSQPLVSAWECGKIAPSVEDLINIEEALGIDRGTLYFEIASGVSN